MHPRKDIYLRLCEIFAVMIDDNEIKYFDIQKGQFLNMEKSHPVARPAILMSIDSIQYQHMTKGYIEGIANVTLQVVIENRHASFQGTSSRDESLEYLELIEKIEDAVCDVEGETFKDFNLASEEMKGYDQNGLFIYEIVFSTLIHYQRESKKGNTVTLTMN